MARQPSERGLALVVGEALWTANVNGKVDEISGGPVRGKQTGSCCGRGARSQCVVDGSRRIHLGIEGGCVATEASVVDERIMISGRKE